MCNTVVCLYCHILKSTGCFSWAGKGMDCLLYRAPNAVFSWGTQLFSFLHFSLCSTPRPSTGGSPWGISLKTTSSQQGSRHGPWRSMMWQLRWFENFISLKNEMKMFSLMKTGSRSSCNSTWWCPIAAVVSNLPWQEQALK